MPILAACLLMSGGCTIVNVYSSGKLTESYINAGHAVWVNDQDDFAVQTRGFGLVPTQSGWTLGYVEEAYASIKDGHACRLIVFDDKALSAPEIIKLIANPEEVQNEL
jgi:hypothetical protein